MLKFFNRVLKEEIIPGTIRAVDPEQRRLRELQLQQQGRKPEGEKQPLTRQKRYAYQFRPAYWNALAFTQHNNNCYNYANNKATNTFAQPGRGSGEVYAVIDDEAVRTAAINDHLENLENDPAAGAPVPRPPNGKKHLVALAVHTCKLTNKKVFTPERIRVNLYPNP